MFEPEILTALWVSLRLTTIVTAVLAIIGPAVAVVITMLPGRLRRWTEPLLLLPLAMPPTVLGFYFLMVAPEGVPFTTAGVAAVCVVAAAPLAVGSMVTAIDGVDRQCLDAATCLGLTPTRRFLRVTLPLCRRGFTGGLLLAAAHTMGAFGVVLMVGGSIAGQTRTLSIVIYDRVQTLDYAAAGRAAVWLLAGSVLLLVAVGWISPPPVARRR